MKTKLQILTLTLLGLAIILFAFTKISYEAHDKIAKDILNINTILCSLWFAFTIIFVIIKGAGKKPFESVISLIRVLFIKPVFLLISLILILFANISLSYQLIFYRQIEFVSNEKIVLYESKKNGQHNKIGDVPKDEPIKYRLNVGVKHVYYEIVKSGKTGSLEPFTIHFIWKEKEQAQKRITIRGNYEKL